MKGFLIDTHALLWFLKGDSQLPTATKTLIENTNNRCIVSIATIWEIAIKVSIGKLNLGISIQELEIEILKAKLEMLPLKVSHIEACVKLPWHHRDPFDRMLIGQSIQENLQIVSNDHVFPAYPIGIWWK